MLHSRGGRTPLYMIQQSQGIARTHMLPDQIKKKVLKIVKAKIKEFDVTSTFSQQFLQATNNSGNLRHKERSIAVRHCRPQCGHPCADALPYRLAIQKVSIRQGSVVSKKIMKEHKRNKKNASKRTNKKNPEPNPFEVAWFG